MVLVIHATSYGPALYWSKRIGKNNKVFMMPKFRTMLKGESLKLRGREDERKEKSKRSSEGIQGCVV